MLSERAKAVIEQAQGYLDSCNVTVKEQLDSMAFVDLLVVGAMLSAAGENNRELVMLGRLPEETQKTIVLLGINALANYIQERAIREEEAKGESHGEV